jgi:hypothetical protein
MIAGDREDRDACFLKESECGLEGAPPHPNGFDRAAIIGIAVCLIPEQEDCIRLESQCFFGSGRQKLRHPAATVDMDVREHGDARCMSGARLGIQHQKACKSNGGKWGEFHDSLMMFLISLLFEEKNSA